VEQGGRAVIEAEELPFDSPKFRQLTWVGFVSDANVPAVIYLDNVKLHAVAP
jgi:hypothetical protein